MTAGGHNDGWRGRWPGRVLRFPVTRIVLGFLAIIVVATTTAGCSGRRSRSGTELVLVPTPNGGHGSWLENKTDTAI